MCGIAGIVSFTQSVNHETLKSMTDSIAHRGPDGQGHWISEDGRTGFGHRRLSIIDLSAGGAQPMTDVSGRYTITFNGEIYNYIELKNILQSKGYKFQTGSDTEVLLAMYDEYGAKCLELLDGMFAFAIHDKHSGSVFVARDRFGEKPFYFVSNSTGFVFASEMKALFAAGCERKVSDERLHYYLAFNLYQDPRDPSSTFFSNVKQLAPSHYMIISSDGNMKTERYWSIDTNREIEISLGDAMEQFNHLMRESITRRLRSDVPVGSSLSGGLDSSTIVLLINAMKGSGQDQKTFSARFRDFAKDEGNYIHEVLKLAPTAKGFETWPDGDLLLNDLEKIIYHQEEPFGSASIVAQWSVMKLAKENNVTVLLDGQGADEILCGYRQFFQPFLNSMYAKRHPEFEQQKNAILKIQKYEYNVAKATTYMLRYPKAFRAASSVKSIFRRTPVASGFPDNGIYTSEFYDSVRKFSSPFKAENNDHVKKQQLRIIEQAGFGPLLRYADRNSMAHARELRLPFLSHTLVEFCFALPDRLKIHNGWTKYLLRETYKDLLPETITWRKDKVGFEAPQASWMEAPQAKEMVNAAKEKLVRSGLTKEGKSFDDWKTLMTAHLLDA